MALMHIPLERVEQRHLQALIDAKASESRSIDYKRNTYGNSDGARAEFLADVSSFANSVGGDLVIGMTATAGVPTAFMPFEADVDAERLRLEQMARAGLEPRIANFETKSVSIHSGGAVIVVRVPRSYSLPHRVIFQNKNRFWARSSAGKYEPNVLELRTMFEQAPSLAERMQNFRLERIALIDQRATPLLLQDYSCLVVHVVPFSHFAMGPTLSIRDIAAHSDRFPPIGGLTNSRRVNFDGLVTLSNPEQSASTQRAYVQIFRTGAIEAVASGVLRGGGTIEIPRIDSAIVHHVRLYAMALHEHGIDPPFAVMAGLIGVQGAPLVRAFRASAEGAQAADRDDFLMAPVILEEVPAGDPQCAIALKPILDQLWNAAGCSSPLSFDGAGDYILRHA
jgi:hypothetical protein